MTKHFIPHIDNAKYPALHLDMFIIYDAKIIFLNDANLEILKGYKAQVLKSKKELTIVLTGLSEKAKDTLFSELKPLEVKQDAAQL